MTTDPDALRAMPDGKRLAALRALSPSEPAQVKARTRDAREAAGKRYGPARRLSPWDEDPPDIAFD
ncbi:hypothetical protein [Streptomyces sp. NBC_01506]|uniref:hypothetical protein n=1 Tax=Streptomyces sp. NBC_01506 TaxID=2903887 RepID=UPI003864AE06